ncbi:DUF2637 domain-containing protein [Streptomyces sp. NPDC004838]
MAAMQLTRTHRILIGVVVAGAVIIAGIGFAGSYAAVRDLAERKGFGSFAVVFPIGIDAGICVLLALDLLLTWLRIPFPMLRQTAWLLTIATIAFNGAASWPDPLGVGMHAVIPVLFVVSVEAARHAIGRIADITADKHMEGVRLTRWLLSPIPTFKLWRRMKLWELRSYEQVIKLEQERLIYQARLQARFGRAWRRKAPVESLMPLRLAKYGVPLTETAPAGLAAAGVDPVLLPPPPPSQPELELEKSQNPRATIPAQLPRAAAAEQPEQPPRQSRRPGQGHERSPQPQPQPHPEQYEQPQPPKQYEQYAQQEPYDQNGPYEQFEQYERQRYEEYQRYQEYQRYAGQNGEANPWFAYHQTPDGYEGSYDPAYSEVPEPEPEPIRIPAGPGGRTRILGDPDLRETDLRETDLRETPGPEAAAPGHPVKHAEQVEHAERGEHTESTEPAGHTDLPEPVRPAEEEQTEKARAEQLAEVEDLEFYEAAYPVFVTYSNDHGDYPKVEQLDIHLSDVHGITHPRSAALLRQAMPRFKKRFQEELESEHIA